MKKFLVQIIRFAAIGAIPFFVLLLGYCYLDPFKVIYTYNDYSYSYVSPNRDYISTETFINNQKKQDYNSFIFGSSRSLAFRPSSWKKHLSKEDRPFMFDASMEPISGIYQKIKYLDSIHANLKNVLLLICRDYTFWDSPNYNKHPYIKHPAISGKSNLYFQYVFFKVYLTPGFLYSFYDYTFTKKHKPYMERFIEKRKITYDSITNEINILDQEYEITNTPDEYYKKRKAIFYKRAKEKVNDKKMINNEKLAMLREIKQIFKKHKTNYKVIMSPLYEQFKLMPSDLDTLHRVFGNNFHDFSGKNAFTDEQTNYYESSHYRPSVGDSILAIIYK